MATVQASWDIPSADAHAPLRLAALAALAATGLAGFAIACLSLLPGSASALTAVVWLANALVCAVVLRRPATEAFGLLAAHFVALAAAQLLAGLAPLTALTLALANTLEATIFVRMMRGRMTTAEGLDARPALVRFLAAGTMAAAASAVVTAGTLAASGDAPGPLAFAQLFGARALGLYLLVPLLLSLARPRAGRRRDWNWVASGVVALVAMACFTVLNWARTPLLFFIAPLLALATLRLGLGALMACLALVAGEAVILTHVGEGPIAAFVAPDYRALTVQLFIASLVLLALPLRALLEARDRANDAFAASERKFRRIAEASPAGVMHLNGGGVPTFANQRWTQMTGLEGRALERGGWLSMLDEGDRQEARRLWARCRAMVEPGCDEFRFRRADGSGGWANLSIYPQHDAAGAQDGFVVRLSDVSDRRAIEDALKEREELYRLVTENAQDLVLRLSRDGRVLYASSSARRLLRIEPAQLIGRKLSEFGVAEDVRRIDALTDEGVGRKVERKVDFRLRRRGGTPLWVEAACRLQPRHDGAPEAWVVNLRDIDSRRQTELAAAQSAAETRESNRVLQLAEALAGVGHWRFDFADHRLDLSAEFRRLFTLAEGRPARVAELLGRLSARDRFAVLRTVARARRADDPQNAVVELDRGESGGRQFKLLVQGDRGADGRLTGLVGMVHEITDQARSRAGLIAARDDARRAAEAKSLFLATMSHEIRTPMTGVLGMIDLLMADPSADERERYLATLKQSADLLMTVLDDILDFSKIEAGTLRLEEEDVDLAALVQSTADLFATAASRKGLLLDLHLPAGACGVRCDPVRVQQVISNFLSNAIKFTARGSVAVTLARPGPHKGWRLEVADSGIGLSESQCNLLFEPFVQADPSTSRRYGGTGLGLAISRRVIAAMGGTVGVHSTLGQGSRFWFEVELAPSRAAPKSRPQRAPRAAGSPLDILFAEDNPVNRLLVQAMLRKAGHRVTCVENGLQAVEYASEHHYDVILMDMQMPELDGLAATRAIRNGDGLCAQVPIYALSADASPERRRFYDGAGLTGFLTKPIDQQALLDTLADASAQLPEGSGGQAGRGTRDGADGGVSGEARRGPSVPLLDEERLAELEESLGGERMAGLLRALADECTRRPAEIAARLERDEVAAALAEAHSLKGAAASLGAAALARSALALEQAGTSADRQRIAGDMLAIGQHTRDEIGARLATPLALAPQARRSG